jgi:hypothetical protein
MTKALASQQRGGLVAVDIMTDFCNKKPFIHIP